MTRSEAHPARRTPVVTWRPGLPLPEFANRETLAAIIGATLFPVAARTISRWPLVVRRVNGHAVFKVDDALIHARALIDGAPAYRQA